MSRSGSLKPLRQSRLNDYFPAAEGKHSPQPAKAHAFDHTRSEGGATLVTAEDVPTKWRTILSLEMKGTPQTKIAEILGMTDCSVSRIRHDPRYIEYRDNYFDQLDRDFYDMKPLAFDALRAGLGSNDENVALRAAETWFKGANFGGYSRTAQSGSNVTAEDVARQLLQVNVQVNVNKEG